MKSILKIAVPAVLPDRASARDDDASKLTSTTS